MLVKITTQCLMNCSHCLEDAKPNGDHMGPETFINALKFIEKLKQPMIMISGGEPTNHPLYRDFVKMAHARGLKVITLSNGLFLETSLKDRILNLPTDFQITNYEQYYPIKVNKIKNKKIFWIDESFAPLSPFGRAKTNNLECSRNSPPCFNFRSICKSINNLPEAILQLRLSLKMCTPSINIDGSIGPGESRFCPTFGTVEDSLEDLHQKINEFRCNECGLFNNLSEFHQQHVGEVVNA